MTLTRGGTARRVPFSRARASQKSFMCSASGKAAKGTLRAVPPPVSVITPARDAARTLPALLDALAAQELAPDEVIVIDDGSRDETRLVAERHPVVTAVICGEGRGP